MMDISSKSRITIKLVSKIKVFLIILLLDMGWVVGGEGSSQFAPRQLP